MKEQTQELIAPVPVPEPIEWLVLDKKDGKVLVLSRYTLDNRGYGYGDDGVTRESCSLRSWLNDVFYRTAFDIYERSAIQETVISTKDNEKCGTEGGRDTKDKVFLLSIEDIQVYFNMSLIEHVPYRRAKDTEYAKANGNDYVENKENVCYGNGEWWLRSPGKNNEFVTVVGGSGFVYRDGYVADYDSAIRLALWIDGSYQEPVGINVSGIPNSSSKELKNTNVGEYFTFGTYEQDNNLSNGGEPIEWLVLEKKGGKALVLSKYALACKKYNETYSSVTWETCTLRNWLNEEFLFKAFNNEEQSAIIEILNQNPDNNTTEGGNATKDKIFLLSFEEITTYFGTDKNDNISTLGVRLTEYAKAQGDGNMWMQKMAGMGRQCMMAMVGGGFGHLANLRVTLRGWASYVM